MGLLLPKTARLPPQARLDSDTYFDSSPFASALDSTLRPAFVLFLEARFASMILSLILAAAYAYMAFGASMLHLTHRGTTALLPCASLPTSAGSK
eukprot:6178510-Pleurochrysis_carterae.AAC.3